MLHMDWLTPKLLTWVLAGIVLLVVLKAVGRRFSRVVGLFVLAGQLPGDVANFVDDLVAEPSETMRTVSRAEIWHFVKCAIVSPQKMSLLGYDDSLTRLTSTRERFEKEGWRHVTFTTSDGVVLDGCVLPPPSTSTSARQRWVVFMNANMQKYEEWLFYFHRYASELGVGMLVFNWRGVGHSGGAAMCLEDLVKDGTAAIHYLLAREVSPANVLVHGLSIGACVAAVVRARFKVAEQGPVILDRPFSTLTNVLHGYVAFAVDGPMRNSKAWKRGLARFGLGTLAHVISFIVITTGWQGRTMDAFNRLYTTRIVTFHRADNIIHFNKASLYMALLQRFGFETQGAGGPYGREPVRWHAVELRSNLDDWLPHDMPLYLDAAWPEIKDLEWRALGLVTPSGTSPMREDAPPVREDAASGANAHAAAHEATSPGRGGEPSVTDRAKALFTGSNRGAAGASHPADVANGAYTRML